MKVTLVAISRKFSSHKVMAVRELEEIPDEGDRFQVKELGTSVIITTSINLREQREIQFLVPHEEVRRLADRKGWQFPDQFLGRK